MSRARFKGLNTEIAYPWSVDAEMPQDVSGLDMSEIIYGDITNIDSSPDKSEISTVLSG